MHDVSQDAIAARPPMISSSFLLRRRPRTQACAGSLPARRCYLRHAALHRPIAPHSALSRSAVSPSELSLCSHTFVSSTVSPRRRSTCARSSASFARLFEVDPSRRRIFLRRRRGRHRGGRAAPAQAARLWRHSKVVVGAKRRPPGRKLHDSRPEPQWAHSDRQTYPDPHPPPRRTQAGRFSRAAAAFGRRPPR